MKVKKNFKKTRVVAIILCICLLVSGAATVWGAQGGEGLLPGMGYLRPIKVDYLDTLEENSKWREEPLNSQLEEALENDLTDTSECEQVWEFSADDYEEVREWCLDNPKGTETNKEFLKPENFGENCVDKQE